jgi:Domain of Unknown Function (DUF1259)
LRYWLSGFAVFGLVERSGRIEMKRSMVTALLLCSLAPTSAGAADWQEVEKALGRKGTPQGEMLKVALPRSDLSVKVGEVTVEPGLALTSWIGFRTVGSRTMMMGDLVLLEAEVAPVMTKLEGGGIAVTALHNHLLGATPSVVYLHFSGEGNPTVLAGAMRAALAASATPLVSPPGAGTSAIKADWTKVEAIMGRSGQKKGNLLQVGFPRGEKIAEMGMEVPPFLGTATAINLQMVGEKTAASGDFVLLAAEVNPVVRALLDHGLVVTAIHSHMLSESPRLFFLHFWGYAEPEKVAHGLRAALDRTGSVR